MKVGDPRAATSSSPSATAGQRGSASICRCRESSGDPMGAFGVVGDTGELHQGTTTCGGGSWASERGARTVGRCHYAVSPAAVMGFYFFPRGGSAQVARYLCRALAGGPWDPMLFAGSLGTASEFSNAGRFFGGVRCRSLDYTPAADRWADGEIRCQRRCRCTPRTRTSPVSQIGSSSISTMRRSLDRSTVGRSSWLSTRSPPRAWCTCITSPRSTRRSAPVAGRAGHHPSPRHRTEDADVRAGWNDPGSAPDGSAAGGWSGCSDGPASRTGWWSSPPTTINSPWSSWMSILHVSRRLPTGSTPRRSPACSLNCPTTHAVEALARRRSSWLVPGWRRGIDLIRVR